MMLYIFDKDGTLVGVPDPSQDRPANTPQEQVLLPGVLEKIDALRAQGHKIAIASNQGGVAWGFISYQQARNLMRDCSMKIRVADYWTFCPYDPKAVQKYPNGFYSCDHPTRKPNHGMVTECMDALGFYARETVYVGDQDTDRQAAEAAGVTFVWAANFFGWSKRD